MRFHPEGPSIPDILLERRDAGRVVFLCGAGVSISSGMPTFVDLAQYVIERFAPPANSEIMTAFKPWLSNPSSVNIPLDQIFNLLHHEYGKDEVNRLVTERLSISQERGEVGREHALLKRISSNQSGVPQIVTTNFDRLFEIGHDGKNLAWHVPPAFPELKFSSKIEGITYLHDRLVEVNSESHPYILNSADFGRAYLSEGWATKFVKLLLEQYIVVLVGYQAEDPPIKYLLQGLNHDGQYDRSRLYAFDRGLPEEIEAKWRDRGVTAIAYSDHPMLWKSMAAWAERADDPRKWRASVIAKSQQDPKTMAPYERGQIAHVLRTAQGARLFSEAVPRPHPEWVCVMDANIRSAKQKRICSDDEVFDPGAAYGLDDDLRNISDDELKQGINNDNLLIWREEDDSPPYCHRLTGGFEALPKRLYHLVSWFGKSLDSPVIAWWAIQQNRLHPQLLQQLEWQSERPGTLHTRARHAWSLILEHNLDTRNYKYNNDWFDLKARINAVGWTASVIREFRRVTTPRLVIKPPCGLGEVRPPSGDWEKIQFSELGQCELVFPKRHNEDLGITDDVLPQIINILEQQLTAASELLSNSDALYFKTPSCYPDRKVEGKEFFSESGEILLWFVTLFDRMADMWPDLANAHATIWPATEQFFFRKLKLYAFNKKRVFKADHVAEEVLALKNDEFWDTYLSRELLFLLVDRWKEFSQVNRNQITERIVGGPSQIPYCSDEEFPVQRDELAASYASYLKSQGCG